MKRPDPFTTPHPEPPKGYEGDLGSYERVLIDYICGEPLAYGFRLVRYMGEERFNGLRNHGKLTYIETGFGNGYWVLATDFLTPEKAVKLYGKVTRIRVGPRGGWKSAFYGEKEFGSKELDPRGVIEGIPEVTIV